MARLPRREVVRLGVLCLGTVLGCSGAVRAENPIFDAKGFNPTRTFFSQLPFEHIDPLTGNVLLTFTDLTLPGNGGFDLRIQRTYNSKIYELYGGGLFSLGEDSWAGLGWSLHFGRLLNWPPGASEPGR